MSGFTPVGNVRDMIVDVIQGDWLDAGINAAGIIFDGADVTKTVGKISKFLKNNAKNTALYAEILSFLNKNFPETLEYLGKNDEFIEVTKKISLEKEDKITKKQHDELKEILDKIGLDDVVESGTNSWIRNLENTSDLNIDDFLSLKDNGVVKVNASGSDRPLYGVPNSYYKTGNGEHIFVYDGDGKLIYDISSSRVKGFKINVDPKGVEYYQAYKLQGAVPNVIKELFGW